jgi:hypothetical protein
MRRALFAAAVSVAAAALVAGTALPALAGDTTTTFTLDTGGLSISEPPTADLGTGPSDRTPFDGQLGSVHVVDERGALDSSWTSEASSTDFTTGAGTPSQTIPNGNINYWSGPATATTGDGTFTPATPSRADQQPMNVSRTAFSHTGGTGNNDATWDPDLVVYPPSLAVAGVYTGTVTHSVF